MRFRALLRKEKWHLVEFNPVLSKEGMWFGANGNINTQTNYDQYKEMRMWCNKTFDPNNFASTIGSGDIRRFAFKFQQDQMLFLLKWGGHNDYSTKS